MRRFFRGTFTQDFCVFTAQCATFVAIVGLASAAVRAISAK